MIQYYSHFEKQVTKADRNEKIIIGYLLANPELLESYHLTAKKFYFANSRLLFNGILSLLERKEEVNPLNLYIEVKNDVEGLSVISEAIHEAKNHKKSEKKEKNLFLEFEENFRNRNMLRLINLVDTANA